MNFPQSRYYEYSENLEFEYNYNDYKELAENKISKIIQKPHNYCILYLSNFYIDYYYVNSLKDYDNIEWNIMEYCSLYDNNRKTIKHFHDKFELKSYLIRLFNGGV